MPKNSQNNSGKGLKLLIFSHSSEIGGGELSMLDFFDFWAAQNKNLELLFIIKYPVDRLGKELDKRGWNYKVLDYSHWSAARVSLQRKDIFRNTRRNSKVVLEIDKIIQNYNPDIVMTNTIVAPWAAFAAKLNGLPHIWFVREYGDIDHGHTFEIGREETFEDIGLLSELVVTNSLALRKHAEKYIKPDKVAPLYTPFKVEKIAEMSEKKISSPFSRNSDLKAVMTGVIRESKGQAQAIEAVSKLKEKQIIVELCLIGPSNDSKYEAKLKKLAENKGVDKQVHFVGKQTNPYAYIRYADVGIMASRMEAFGRVTFEYLTLGKPVVGAASGGTLEMIKDGKNGFLYEPGNVKQIADKLELYSKDFTLLKKHKKSAKSSALHMIHGEYGAEMLIEKIHKLLNAKEKPYKLPNFTRHWLGIPKIAEEINFRSSPLHKLRVAKKLGPKKTFLEVKKRLSTKVK